VVTRFLDGAAAGERLMLRRAPLYLRVVRNAKGEWDALDQLTDRPKRDETIHVYRREGAAFPVHLNSGRLGCGWYHGSTYRALDPEATPIQAVLRDTARWRAWVLEQLHTDHVERLGHEAAARHAVEPVGAVH